MPDIEFSAEEESQMDAMREADHAPEPELPPDAEADIPVEADGEAAPEEDTRGEPRKETTVPYGALREERDRRQKLADQLEAANQRMARMEEAFQRLVSREAPREKAPPKDDPDAYNAWQLEQINKRLEGTERATKEQQAQAQKREQAQAFLNRYAEAAEEYAKVRPDLKDAYDHVYKARDEELRITGYSDPADRRKILEFEEEQLVVRAFRAGDNPAERIYQLAEARGYRPGSREDKVDTLEKGQRAAKSLSNTRGRGETPVTLQQLAELEGAAFDKAWEAARQKGLLG